MSVFLYGHVRDAQRLLEEKARFRELEHTYAANHIARLQVQTAQSIETSSLHLDLLSELKRINSHLCSIAYPILESAGVLAATRLRQPPLAGFEGSEPATGAVEASRGEVSGGAHSPAVVPADARPAAARPGAQPQSGASSDRAAPRSAGEDDASITQVGISAR